VQLLVSKGVSVPAPATVYVAPEVNLEHISADGVIIHPGCRIQGERTVISANCKLGAQAPATIENCFLGNGVEFQGGYARESVFLDGVTIGSGAQIREACLFEERSSVAHTVGCKQTILFPYATLGSLINFCDCLLAGGTSRVNHSEVGSGYVHFNFAPTGHKATASLFGDVAHGVWLTEPAVFLGGGGGAVGPVQVGYGAVIGAGSTLRADVARETQVITSNLATTHDVNRHAFPRLARLVSHNIDYVAQLLVLRTWYDTVRRTFAAEYADLLLESALRVIDCAITERITRLVAFTNTIGLEDSASRQLHARIIDLASYLTTQEPRLDVALVSRIVAGNAPYLTTIANLDSAVVTAGRTALSTIAAEITSGAKNMLPLLFAN
jgi:UDP-N-acetylglucosamine/UDP-N-acetylgalactosamine diphosphorylase